MILALFGAISYAEAVQLSPKKLEEMYNDPEYADTWRYTNEERYVNSTRYEEDTPAGYRDAAMVQTEEKVPDYWTWDYGGEKHWKFANDPFYSNETSWIEG